MLTYENFVDILLSSVERTQLNMAYTQELLDTHALGRSFCITFLPEGREDDRGPQEPPLRAMVSFRWAPEFTVFSLRGGDSLDNIEHLVDERLNQANTGPSLDVEVTYTIPLLADQQQHVGRLSLLAEHIQELHGSLIDHDNVVRVNAQVGFVSGRAARVQSVTAHQIWSVDEALYDMGLLADTFNELCAELRALLEILAQRFAHPNDDKHGASDGTENVPGNYRYHKPPTA